jgi:hypothetical protein
MTAAVYRQAMYHLHSRAAQCDGQDDSAASKVKNYKITFHQWAEYACKEIKLLRKLKIEPKKLESLKLFHIFASCFSWY